MAITTTTSAGTSTATTTTTTPGVTREEQNNITPPTLQIRIPGEIVRPRKRRSSKSYPSIAELLKDDALSLAPRRNSLSNDSSFLFDGTRDLYDGIDNSVFHDLHEGFDWEPVNKYFESYHPHDCPFYHSY